MLTCTSSFACAPLFCNFKIIYPFISCYTFFYCVAQPNRFCITANTSEITYKCWCGDNGQQQYGSCNSQGLENCCTASCKNNAKLPCNQDYNAICVYTNNNYICMYSYKNQLNCLHMFNTYIYCIFSHRTEVKKFWEHVTYNNTDRLSGFNFYSY